MNRERNKELGILKSENPQRFALFLLCVRISLLLVNLFPHIKLGLKRYESVWQMTHKLCRAMGHCDARYLRLA